MKRHVGNLFAWALIFALIVSFLPASQASSASTTVFINEIHYDNTSTDTGEAIEVAGPAGTDLTGWSLVLYNGTGGAAYNTTALSGTIPDLGGGFGVVVVNYPSNGIQNGSPDGVALVDATTTVVQFLSYEGTFTAVGGPANGMVSTDIGVSESGSGAVGNSLQLTGSGTAYEDFTWVAEAPNTFGKFNTGQTFGSGPVATDPSGVGEATPNSLFAGDTILLTVAVTPGDFPPSTGLNVTCDLSSIGGSTSQVFYDDNTNGDAFAGDNTFSYSTTIGAGATSGAKSLPCTIGDSQGRSASSTIGLTVLVILPIGTVQGSVSNSDNGATFPSPYAGQTVVIQGVIYEKVLSRTSSGGSTYAFFVQNQLDQTDGDPNSSDGIYVYIGGYSTLRIKGGGYYTPTVGDEVILQGPISEYYNFTEIGNPYLLSVVNHNVDLDKNVPAVVADPPANLADANRYWERLEGMRVQVPQNSVVLGGRNVFSPADAEVWVASPTSIVGMRTEIYQNRAFRDAHPLDDNYDPNNWDGNGYRILLGSWGIKATAANNQALIEPLRTFDTINNVLVGGLNYTYSKYRIEVSEQPTFTEGADPAANNSPQAIIDRSTGYSIVDYNLENLYDFRDNPNSLCDFNGGNNTGCLNAGTPFLDNVTPSYNYVPASDADYQARLNDIALQIINDLHSPDVLMVQEVENQDICSITAGALVCDTTTGNPDGEPDVLQELALKVASLGGPAYEAAWDSHSSDLRGIAPAFLYRTDRVELVDPAGNPLLGTNPAIDYPGASVPFDGDVVNPKTLNAVLPTTFATADKCETNWVFPRAPDVGLFRIYSTSIGVGSYRDVYAINNHFKSGPDSCVAHRTEQAKYNAAIVDFLQTKNPYALIVTGGDLNVYPRPDDPFAPIGQTGSSDQLGSLYYKSLGLKNLWEVLLDQAPEAAYSYVYLGMAQTLDQMFINPILGLNLNQFRIAHINSDFPADYPDDVARGTSDHDPNVANFAINFSGFFQPIANPPTLNIVKAGNAIPIKFSLGSDKGLKIFASGYPKSEEFICPAGDMQDDTTLSVKAAGKSTLSYDPLTDQYTFVWKTDKAWAGTCRQLTVMLTDGTVQIANFQLK